MQARFRSPPDTPLMYSDPIFVFAHDSRPSSRIICVTRSVRSIFDIFDGKRTLAENIRFSRTVRVVQIMLSWTTYPASRLKDDDRGKPSTRTWPEIPFLLLRPAKMSRSDDLPHPVGPKQDNATNEI